MTDNKPEVVTTGRMVGKQIKVSFKDGAAFDFQNNKTIVHVTAGGESDEPHNVEMELVGMSNGGQKQLGRLVIPHKGNVYSAVLKSFVGNGSTTNITITRYTEDGPEAFTIAPDGKMRDHATGAITAPSQNLKF